MRWPTYSHADLILNFVLLNMDISFFENKWKLFYDKIHLTERKTRPLVKSE